MCKEFYIPHVFNEVQTRLVALDWDRRLFEKKGREWDIESHYLCFDEEPFSFEGYVSVVPTGEENRLYVSSLTYCCLGTQAQSFRWHVEADVMAVTSEFRELLNIKGFLKETLLGVLWRVLVGRRPYPRFTLVQTSTTRGGMVWWCPGLSAEMPDTILSGMQENDDLYNWRISATMWLSEYGEEE